MENLVPINAVLKSPPLKLTTPPSSISVVPEPTDYLKKILLITLKTLAFLLFSVFMLCLPMGDPEVACERTACSTDPQGKVVAYNYACNIYRVMASTMHFTSNAVYKASDFTGCVLLNALYDAKLKFYNILLNVDQQDLCRSVCSFEKPAELEDSISGTPKDKKPCRCKAKYCKRIPSTTS